MSDDTKQFLGCFLPVILGLVACAAIIVWCVRTAPKPQVDSQATSVKLGGEKTFNPVVLNGKVLSTKETYVVEKQKVLDEMKKIGAGTMDLKTLGDISADWAVIVDKEKCIVKGNNFKFPEDYQRYLDSVIQSLEVGCI